MTGGGKITRYENSIKYNDEPYGVREFSVADVIQKLTFASVLLCGVVRFNGFTCGARRSSDDDRCQECECYQNFFHCRTILLVKK
jgi:hypothetical protein